MNGVAKLINVFNWLITEAFPKVLIVDVVCLIASIIIGGASVDVRGDADIVTKACTFTFFVCIIIAAVLVVFYINAFLIAIVFFCHTA